MFPQVYFAPNFFSASYWPPLGPGTEITWENSNILTRVTRGTQLTTAALPPGDWRLLIKAFDTSGNESAAEAAFDITVANFNDVVVDRTEDPRWLGTLINMVHHHVSNKLVPQSLNLAGDDGFETFDEFVPNPVATATYEAGEIDIGFDSDVRIFAEFGGILGKSNPFVGAADPKLAIDHRLAAGSYDGFEDWTVGSVTARFVKARVNIDTATGVAALKAARIVLDVPERTERGALTVAVGGTAVSFAQPFHLTPGVDVTPEAVGAPAEARTGNPEAITTTGFIAHVFDNAGVSVGGPANWTAIGA